MGKGSQRKVARQGMAQKSKQCSICGNAALLRCFSCKKGERLLGCLPESGLVAAQEAASPIAHCSCRFAGLQFILEYADGEDHTHQWSAKQVVHALNHQGLLLVKWHDQHHVQTMHEIMQATQQMFGHSVKGKRSVLLTLLPGYVVETITSCNGPGLLEHGNFEYVNFRTGESLMQRVPDPTELVQDFKRIFFKVYEIIGDISEVLLKLVFQESQTPFLLNCIRADGPPKSLVRALNYTQQGPGCLPQENAGMLICSPRGITPGLTVKNHVTGRFVYTECSMHDDELVVIAGRFSRHNARNVNASTLAVDIHWPRTALVFDVNADATTVMCSTDLEDDDEFAMFVDLRPIQVAP